MKDDKAEKTAHAIDALIEAEYEGKVQGKDETVYEAKKRSQEDLDNISREWVSFLKQLGVTKADARSIMKDVESYKFSLTYCIKNDVIKLTPEAFTQHLLRYEPFNWQARAKRSVFENPHKDHAFCVGRGAGKTRLCADVGVEDIYQSGGYPYLDGIVSKSIDASGNMFDEVSHFCDYHPLLQWCIKRKTQTEIELDSGAMIAVKPAGYRGAHFNRLMLDECAFFKKDDDIRALEPSIQAKDGVMVVISTPNGTRNYFHEKCKDPSGRTIYMHYPSSARPSYTEEKLASIAATVPKFWYEQEYLARFIDWSFNAFTMDDIDKMFMLNCIPRNSAEDGIEYYAGLDLGIAPDETIFYIGHMKNEHVIVDHYKEFSDEPYKNVTVYVHKAMADFSAKGIAIDALGAGEGVIAAFPAEHTYTIDPIKQSIQWHASAYLDMLHYIERYQVHIPEQYRPKIDKQFKDLIMKETEYGRRPIHPSGEHDDTYSALALLIHTYFSPNQESDFTIMKGKSHY